ncbi:hypothetical protein, partial [Salmonella sp. SAL4432]|uniref:hypothetical protein n=1 Tax=Salmonella sp. SAL4432 TaxID=3159887 RepID=UPI0039795308
SIEADIVFEMELTEAEMLEVYENIKKKILLNVTNLDEFKIESIEGESFTFLELCKKFNKALYIIDLIPLAKRYSYWLVDYDWSVEE